MMARNSAREVGKAFLALHRRLLPANPRIGWIPYLWLFWLVSFGFKWFFVPLDPVEFALALLTLPVFLSLYFDGYWQSGPRVFVNIAGILLITLVWTPSTGVRSRSSSTRPRSSAGRPGHLAPTSGSRASCYWSSSSG